MAHTPFDPATAETWEALARYVSGESTPEETAALRAWLAAEPQRAQLVETMQQMLARVPATPADVDVEAALAEVRARLRADDDATTAAGVPSLPVYAATRARPRRWSAPALRAAAAIAVVAAGVLVWRSSTTEQDAAPADGVLHATTTGQTDTLHLTDGSTVILGPASELRVDADYGEVSREVVLTGVARFEVEHDDDRPFVVHAGDALVRDLGTVFVVSQESAQTVRVTVSEGTVMLRHRDHRDGVLLHGGDGGLLRGGSVRALRGAASAADEAWVRGELVFTDATLAQVASQMQRWYGVHVRVADEQLQNRRVTASFRATEGAQQVLDVIAAALGASVQLRADTAFLRPGQQ